MGVWGALVSVYCTFTAKHRAMEMVNGGPPHHRGGHHGHKGGEMEGRGPHHPDHPKPSPFISREEFDLYDDFNNEELEEEKDSSFRGFIAGMFKHGHRGGKGHKGGKGHRGGRNHRGGEDKPEGRHGRHGGKHHKQQRGEKEQEGPRNHHRPRVESE